MPVPTPGSRGGGQRVYRVGCGYEERHLWCRDRTFVPLKRVPDRFLSGGVGYGLVAKVGSKHVQKDP